MRDLIRRREVIELIHKYHISKGFKEFLQAIEELPTAYDVEEKVKELEKHSYEEIMDSGVY